MVLPLFTVSANAETTSPVPANICIKATVSSVKTAEASRAQPPVTEEQNCASSWILIWPGFQQHFGFPKHLLSDS